MTKVATEGELEFIAGSGGVPLALDRYGPASGQPVILLHGGGQTRHAWGATARRLAGEGYLVLSLDLRGHGDSGWADDADYSLSAFRDDVTAVVDSLDRPPVLVGASMGGIAALLAVGEDLRDRVKALVLVDITPRVGGPGTAKIIGFMNANPDGFADVHEAADAVAGYLPDRPRPSSPVGLMKNLRARNGRLHWHWDPSFISNASEDRSKESGRLAEAAAAVVIPTLLVRGDRSEVVAEEDVAAFRQLMPQAEVADVRGAGHMVAGDQNTVFGDAVASYLRRVAPA
jgi:pimeloyl-ACP methyl ester carboxylesterase